MTAQHTPGPWTVSRGGSIYGADEEREGFSEYQKLICLQPQSRNDLFRYGGPAATAEEYAANARLIAAAPELERVCRLVLTRLDLAAAEHPGSTFPAAALRDDLRAALALIEGA